MSKEHEPTIGEILSALRAKYLEKQKETGGTAAGFRDFVAKWQSKDPLVLDKLAFEALMEATTKAWQARPKKREPDLFSINGVGVQEFFTRTVTHYVDGEEIESEREERFEKVGAKYATINDAFEDAQITSRKAHQTSASAEEKHKFVDEARRRAKGDMSKFLRDVAD